MIQFFDSPEKLGFCLYVPMAGSPRNMVGMSLPVNLSIYLLMSMIDGHDYHLCIGNLITTIKLSYHYIHYLIITTTKNILIQ